VAALRRVLGCALIACAFGCGGGDDAADAGGAGAQAQCLDALPADCTAAYEPSYDAIFDNVLRKTCGSSATGSSCHYGPTAAEAKGGLALSDRDAAYEALLGQDGTHARVVPGDAECSLLMQRLESKDVAVRMPLGGDPLPDNVRCVIRKWIENGAERGEAKR
jgi:hypothetical protein